MPRFVHGVLKFQKDVFPGNKDMFERLSAGQSPEALFITCSDSRIETGMMTQTMPGELFICRNAGNIVPPHTNQTGGMTASIEFASAVLEVPHIVICGHSDCGAIKGAMDLHADPASLDRLPHVREWLGFTRAAVDIVDALGAGMSETERKRMLTEQNVILQLQHLRTHPTVATRLATGGLELHGWVYDLARGAVDAYDETKGRFVPIEERYAL